jgi:amino-acid N-acetyltransferase
MPVASVEPFIEADDNVRVSGSSVAHSIDDGSARIRRATEADVRSILALISANLAAGHLLPRSEGDVRSHVARFLVVERDAGVIGCAELAPLSRAVAEVRSLVVDDSYRGRGFGSQIVEELQRWARRDGFSTLCAFTHHPSHFVRLGFSIVPHQWLPEKIAIDCVGCPKFRRCNQYAMALSLRGRSIRTTPAGQRPYLALPPSVPPVGFEDPALSTRRLLPMAAVAPRVQ